MSENAFIDTMRTRTMLDAAMYFISLPLENSSEGYLMLKAQARSWLLAEHARIKAHGEQVFNTVPQPELDPAMLDVDTFPDPPEVVILIEDSACSVVAATIDHLRVHIIDLDHPNDNDILGIGERRLQCDRSLVFAERNPERVQAYINNPDLMSVERYADLGGMNCPRCKGEHTTGDGIKCGTEVSENRFCSDCGFEWVDTYHLNSYTAKVPGELS